MRENLTSWGVPVSDAEFERNVANYRDFVGNGSYRAEVEKLIAKRRAWRSRARHAGSANFRPNDRKRCAAHMARARRLANQPALFRDFAGATRVACTLICKICN